MERRGLPVGSASRGDLHALDLAIAGPGQAPDLPKPGLTERRQAGSVMIDLASITKLNILAVPSGSGSVYFDVSSRVMNGPSASSRRRIHFTFEAAFEAGQQEPGRIPLLGPQRLAVLRVRD